MMKRSLLVLSFALAASPALAISVYRNQIPNGNTFSCSTCHESQFGGEGWNAFGKAILVAGGANPDANPNDQNAGFVTQPSDHWLDICGDDSDGDGATNGEELGDPNCDFPNTPAGPAADVSNPGDETSVPGAPGDPGGGGGGDDPGGCASTASAPLALALLAILRARRRR